jgi:hypothetical protein
MSVYATVVTKRSWNHVFPPVCQIEQNNFGFDAILGDAHEERAQTVLESHNSRSQKRNGNPADGPIREACNMPAESEAQSTHEV